MDVLVLAWRGGQQPAGHRLGHGVSARAAGVATSLARAGAQVRLVTRHVEGPDPGPRLTGCEVYAVPDPPPVLPDGLAGEAITRLGLAGPVLAAVTRRLHERPADLTIAIGRDTLPVAARLPIAAGVLVLERDPGPGGRHERESVLVVAAALARAGRRVVLAARYPDGSDPLAGVTAAGDLVLPAAAPARRPRPGAPPAAGPVRLVVPEGTDRRRVADTLRAALDHRDRRRTVTGSDRRRPAVSLVLAHDDEHVLRAASWGVPVVTARGAAAAAGRALHCGIAATGPADAATTCADLLADDARAAALGAAGLAASERARSRTVALLRSLVAAPDPPTRGTRSRPDLRVVE